MPKGLNRNNKREYLSVVVHCSASDRYNTTIERIRGWHINERKWNDIGYHKVITGDGVVHQGRPDTVIGAGAEGWNEDSLHVCVTGNFDKDAMEPSHPQYKALTQVLATLAKRHNIPVAEIIGHRDVYTRLGQPQAKSCPGKTLYALLPALREAVAAYL